MSIKRILSLMLALVLLVGSMPAFAKSTEILVLESLADSAEEEIAEEASVAVEEALPAEEPMEILPELPAPKIIMQPEWQAVEGTSAMLIPAAEKIRFEWEEVADAAFYRIETSGRPAEGEEEVRVEIGRVEENHIDLTAANYSGDWYALYITAEAADGRVSFDACIFRVEEPAVEEPVEEEVAEEIDVSVEETALTIVSYPKSVTVAEGEKATVTVEAQGDGLSYVWYTREASSDTYYKSSISGPTYSVVMNAARSGRRLICYVSDKYGNKIQCPTVQIKMKNPLEIVSYPQNVTVAEGEKATVTVEARGDGLTYTWYTREANSDTYYKSSISGPSYSVVMNAARSGRRLICYVSDKYGNKIQCPTVQIMMKTPLEIITYPQNTAAADGQTATVTVEARGDGLTYTWYTREANSDTYYKSSISGPSYSVVMNAARSGRRLICYVSDKYGNKIQCPTVLIKLKPALTITQDIADVAVDEGKTAKVTVKATGSGLTYAWYFKDPGATKFSLTNSYKTASYDVTMTAARNGRQVYCVITDAYGESIQSATATLKIRTPLAIIPDFSNSAAYEGEKVKLIVAAAGDGLTYSWYTKEANQTKFYKSSVTGNTYSVEMTAARNGRQVYCVVGDAYGNTERTETVTLEMKTVSFYYEVNSSGTLTIMACNDEPPANLVIPTRISGVTVTAIGDYAFCGWENITSVTIPNSVKKIGYGAFDSCSGLTKITLGSSVENIDDSAFAGCSSLRSITIPDSVKSIGEHAFSYCSSLTSINIPNGMKSIGEYAFYNCSSLTSISIPDSVTSIGNSAFENCSSLIKAIIGSGVTSMGEYIFYGCRRLASVEIGACDIDYGTFDGCSSLETLVLDSGSIGAYVFEYCDSLTSVTLNSGSIGEFAFNNCKSLATVTLGSGVTGLGNSAFSGCDSLTTVTLGIGIRSIGTAVFSGCSSLKNINIPNNVRSIGEDAFYGCSSLTSITLPNNVKSIGNYAFYGCSSLASVNFPDGMESIGEWAFRHCDSLASIAIPDSVETIGKYAFYYCDGLTEVTIGSSSIGDYAFYNCDHLETLTVNSGSIGAEAFAICSDLERITLGRGVTSIGYDAFYYCNNAEFYVYSGSYAHSWCKINYSSDRYTVR